MFKPETNITPFPPKPVLMSYTNAPVLKYDAQNQTYLVTKEYMNNSLMNDIFVEEILKWKRNNGL